MSTSTSRRCAPRDGSSTWLVTTRGPTSSGSTSATTDPARMMDVGEHIDALRREGELLTAVAADLTLDTALPTCPEWVLRDLLLHLGGVHRWAAAHVADARTEPIDIAQPIDMLDVPPTDDELREWFAAGHNALVVTL